MNLAFRLLCLICGVLLVTMSATLLSRSEPATVVWVFGVESERIYEVLNGYYTVLGIFLAIVGFALIIASYYRHQET